MCCAHAVFVAVVACLPCTTMVAPSPRVCQALFQKNILRSVKKHAGLPRTHNARVEGSRARKNIAESTKKQAKTASRAIFGTASKKRIFHHTRLRAHAHEGQNAIIIRAWMRTQRTTRRRTQAHRRTDAQTQAQTRTAQRHKRPRPGTHTSAILRTYTHAATRTRKIVKFVLLTSVY